MGTPHHDPPPLGCCAKKQLNKRKDFDEKIKHGKNVLIILMGEWEAVGSHSYYWPSYPKQCWSSCEAKYWTCLYNGSQCHVMWNCGYSVLTGVDRDHMNLYLSPLRFIQICINVLWKVYSKNVTPDDHGVPVLYIM